MRHALPILIAFLITACGSNTAYHGDATAEPDAVDEPVPDADVGDPVALPGFMFTTRNLMDIPVYVQLWPSPVDEIAMERDLGAGWESFTLFRPDGYECPMRPDECICETPVEPWQMREILPDGEYQMGWAPSPSPSSDCYVVDEDFCADCSCYRRSSIWPGRYAFIRCVYNDYRCTESDPCGPESVGYYRPAEPAGDMICVRREVDVPGTGSAIDLPIDP